MYLSQGGYRSSRTVYVSQGGYSSGSTYLPHSGVIHSAGPMYLDPNHAAAVDQYRRAKMLKKISGSTITGKPLAYAEYVHHPVVHGSVIDSHTHHASVGIRHHEPAVVIAHNPALSHVSLTDSGHYYGRSDYEARKEAEYKAKYGGKYGVVGAVSSTHAQGACIVNEDLDAYVHSSGTGFKQWLRRRKARKEIKRAVQYELLHQALAQRHGSVHHASPLASVHAPEHAASASNGTEV